MKRLRKILISLLCLMFMLTDIAVPVNAMSTDNNIESGLQAKEQSVRKLDAFKEEEPVYDPVTGYYVKTDTETNTYLDGLTNCYITTRKTITKYYILENDTYVLREQKENTQIVSAIPATNASPSPSPSFSPLESPSPSPSAVPSPTTTPIVFSMKKDAVKVTAKRASDKKANLSWDTVDEATGYIIYKSVKENSGYKKLKTIEDPYTDSYTSGGLSKNKVYYYRVYAYQTINDESCMTDKPEPVQVSTITVKKITDKLKKLRKKFPNGKYWNHVGYRVSKGQDVSGFVTDRPCNHDGCNNGVASTCNYYLGTDHVLGYQCSGYASLLSDKIFGKSKYRRHTSFSKAKVGDVVRYSGHSVLITEKHTNYIVVTECNYGNTCIIKWGRRIAKSKLTGAVYRTRY